MLQLKRQPTNVLDSLAVAVMNGKEVVGHVPFNLAPTISHFLQREGNSGVAEITGQRLNRGAGFGLEVPCIYRLRRPKAYTDRAKELLTPNSGN